MMAESTNERFEVPDDIERWPLARLERYQLDRLREVISRAATEVPLYTALWKQAGLSDIRIASRADLSHLPMVTKEDYLAAGREGLRPVEGPVGFSTRGTSGDPLIVWIDEQEKDAYVRPTARGFRWAGLRPGMCAMLMSPVWHRLAACEGHAVAQIGARAAYFWGSMDTQYIDTFRETLADLRPEFVTQTAPFLLSIIRHCDAEGVSVSEIFADTQSIVVVGLPLTPYFRRHLEERLGVGVFERGGTQEGAALDECEVHSGPHIHEDVCCLEVVDTEGRAVPDGERGHLVVTKLTPGSVFVRYNTGDVAAFLPGGCSCGRTFRRLKIYGRPESSVTVGGHNITAYDVRLCVDVDAELVGRNVLLVRPSEAPSDELTIALEGEAHNAAELEDRLHDQLDVRAVKIHWLGRVEVAWGFRQVIEQDQLRLPVT
jgi:phenylacetate-CoA ligase